MQTPDDNHGAATAPAESFPTDPTGLPEAGRPQVLGHGDTLHLRVTPVAKRLGDTTGRMLGYNGSVPGPTLKVRQGSEIIVEVENQGDLETTVHWHGLRLENRYDGVPHETQAPIPVGGRFTYRIQFPDAGLYWYHPHIREDYTQELGQDGNILVAQMDDPAALPEDAGPVTYACPMHPEVTSDQPGRCPKCGMKLLAVLPGTQEHTAMDDSHMDHAAMDDGDLHGAGRFLVLARDGVPEPNLVWKDTVLVRTGQVVDILFDVTNPGLWMAHCHIAEHMQSGMMFSFNVAREGADR